MNNEVDLCVTISLNYLPPPLAPGGARVIAPGYYLPLLSSLGLQQLEPQAMLEPNPRGWNIRTQWRWAGLFRFTPHYLTRGLTR